jgi:hypothetical protein
MGVGLNGVSSGGGVNDLSIKKQKCLVNRKGFLWGLVVCPAGTGGGDSAVTVGEQQRVSGVSCCRQPKRT